MHLDIRQKPEDFRHIAQLRPVELEILPRREMAVAAIELLADQRELPQLARRERAIGDGDAQHVGVKLEIDAVLESERLELVFCDRTVEAARDLIRELGHPLAHETLVEFIVAIHGQALRWLRSVKVESSACLPRSSRMLGPRILNRSRKWRGTGIPRESTVTSTR